MHKITSATSIFTLSKKNKDMDASWTPFYVVIVLFVLAILSPWLFPNKMVSKNKHDNKY